jgi:hypothetical protein
MGCCNFDRFPQTLALKTQKKKKASLLCAVLLIFDHPDFAIFGVFGN